MYTGRNIDDYEHLTMAEMVFQIDVYAQREKDNRRWSADLALWHVTHVAMGYHEPKKLGNVSRESAFPTLFKTTEEDMIDRFLRGAQAHNERNKGG